MRNSLGRSIRGWRLRRRLSQVDLSRKAQVTQATLSRLENGLEAPRMETLGRLSAALGVAPTEFFSSSIQARTELHPEEIEGVARSILSGERHQLPFLNQLADQIARLLINKLKAHGCPGYQQVQLFRWRAPFRKTRLYVEVDRDTVQMILEKVDSLIPTYAIWSEDEKINV